MILIDPAIQYAPRQVSSSDFKQGSAAWHNSRVGHVTCSRLNDVLAVNKNGKPSQARTDYMAEKITERVLGDITQHYVTAAMQRGTDLEPVARKLYEARRGVEVYEVGLIPHPTIQYFAGSPDGLLADGGMIEIKTCATPQKYLSRVMARDYSEYENQIQGLLACTDRAWCDLIIYDDRFPPNQGMHIARIERDEERIGVIEEAVRVFLAELAILHAQAEEALVEAA